MHGRRHAGLHSLRARWGRAFLPVAMPVRGAAGEPTHLAGSVVDASGAAAPGAAVLLRNADTAFERLVQSDARGQFHVQGLSPARYRLSGQARGFASTEREVETPQGAPVLLALAPAPVVEQLIVVSGSRQEELRDNLNTRVDVVIREQVRDMGYETVGEGLREMPGILTRRGSETAAVAGEQVQGIDEDDPLCAEALLARARALSRDPVRETVILVAHGNGDDAQAAHWRETLASLARRMRELGGDRFRAVRAATWREDWPDKRKPAVEEVRALVQEATADGGRALVIPARTLGRGPERRLLKGLSFELGEGFAPLPLFARWAENEVRAAVAEEAALRNRVAAGGAPDSPPPASRAAARRTRRRRPGENVSASGRVAYGGKHR